MMNLILQLTAQTKEMENEMDNLVQEKKDRATEVLVTVIPVVTIVVPSTLAESLAPIVPMATTLPVTSSTTSTMESSTTIAQHIDEASKLVKAMQDMSIQTKNINRLKEQLKILEYENKLAKIMHKNEEQRENKLNKQLKMLEKYLTLKEPMAQAKKQLWANIIEVVNDIWPSIQVIYEQKDLVKSAREAIQKIKEELGKKPEEALQIIKFINSKKRQ